MEWSPFDKVCVGFILVFDKASLECEIRGHLCRETKLNMD